MNEQDMNRLRADVRTLQAVIGTPLPFGRREVWYTLLLVPCGSVLAVGTAVVPWEHIRWLLLPLGLLMFLYVAQWSRYRRQAGQHGIRRREYSTQLVLGALLGAAVLGFVGFAAPALGLDGDAVGSTALVFVGLMLLSWGILDRRRLASLGGALPLIALGLSLPFTTARQFCINAGMALIVAGLLSAAIMAGQLHQQKQTDG